MGNGCLLRNLVDTDIVACSEQEIDNRFRPVCPVAQQTEVTQWFLWATEFALLLAQFIGKLNEQPAVAMSLMLWQCKNAGNVVAVC